MTNCAFQFARIVNSRARNLNNLVLNLVDKPVVVLGYHRVADLPSDRNSLAVSPGNFRVQMEYLKQNFQIVRFDDDWSNLKGTAIAVTFDDGYADNASEVLPVLEQLEVPATFFISTGPLETGNEFWWDELEGLVLTQSVCPPKFELEDDRFCRTWPTTLSQEREVMFQDLLALMMSVNEERRSRWLFQLRKWGDQSDQAKTTGRPLTKGELLNLAKSRWVTIGAHTVTHSSLAALSEKEKRNEIISSKIMLEELLGREISTLSYPFGKRSDYDIETINICREAGYLKAATAFPGLYYRWKDQYQIPRHFIQNWGLDSFVVKMKSLWI